MVPPVVPLLLYSWSRVCKQAALLVTTGHAGSVISPRMHEECALAADVPAVAGAGGWYEWKACRREGTQSASVQSGCAVGVSSIMLG